MSDLARHRKDQSNNQLYRQFLLSHGESHHSIVGAKTNHDVESNNVSEQSSTMSVISATAAKAGYLQHRPGGALGRWKKRRSWFVLDRSTCYLLYFKSQNDTGQPLGVIDVKDACISLLLEHSNQFLIASGGKEHILTAENHKSMMQWLTALQEVRDQFITTKKERTVPKSFSHKPIAAASPTKGLAAEPSPAAIRRLSAEKRSTLPGHAGSLTPGAFTPDGVVSGFNAPGAITPGAESDTSIESGARRDFASAFLLPSPGTPTASFNGSVPDSPDLSPTSIRSSISITSTDDIGSVGDLKEPSLSLVRENSEHSISDKDSMVFEESKTEEDRDGDAESTSDAGTEDDLEELDKETLILRLQAAREEKLENQRKLKSAMNRETTYQQMLKKREQDIMRLDDKLGQLEQVQHLSRDLLNEEDLKTARRNVLDLQDTLKMYQEQNVFLNSEVRKQAGLKCRARAKMEGMQRRITHMDAELSKCKREFIHLMTCHVEVTSLDHKDNIPMKLDWSDAKYKRFLEMYDSARQKDVTLLDPRVAMAEGITDQYGFQQYHNNQPLLFHQVCHLLDRHIQGYSRKESEHRKSWEAYIQKHEHNFQDHQSEMHNLVYGGVPPEYRSEVWTQLIMDRVKTIKEGKGENYFQSLCDLCDTSPAVETYRRQINLDLLRTIPHNTHFNNEHSKGISQLRQLLEAFCVHNPEIGYCQGMNFIAGMSLLFMDIETAFWCLVAVVEYYFPHNYFDASLIGAQADQYVLKEILQCRLPRLHAHLDDVGVEMCSFTLNWFLAIYFEVVPFNTLLRIWDCFLLDGLYVLFQFSMALLQYHEEALLSRKDILALLKDTKQLCKLSYNIENLVQTVKDNMKEFQSWSWIEERQAHYMNNLQKVYEEQERARKEFEKQEGLTSSSVQTITAGPPSGTEESSYGEVSDHDLKMDCAVEYAQGGLLVCRGDIRQGWISRVDVKQCSKQNIGARLDSRVICMSMAGPDCVLLGTLSWFLYLFNVKTQQELWCERLRDTPLCVTHEDSTRNVYVGLADGTLAVMEGIIVSHPPEVFYHAIGASPVRCIQLIPDLKQIWCASGNSVNILNTSLNVLDGFEMSKNRNNHIQNMELSDRGVWISMRGSSFIALWDIHSLSCLLMYDTSSDQLPIYKVPSDETVMSRITAVMPYNNTLWIGTADGHLTIYDVIDVECSNLHSATRSEDELDIKSNGEDEGVSYQSDDAIATASDDEKTSEAERSSQENIVDSGMGGSKEGLKTGDEEDEEDFEKKGEEMKKEDREGSQNNRKAELMLPEIETAESKMRKSKTLEEFVVVGRDEDGAQEYDPSVFETSLKNGTMNSDKHSRIDFSIKSRRPKNSRKRLDSPRNLKKLLHPRSKSTSSEKSGEEQTSPTSRTSSHHKSKDRVQSVLGKLTHRSSTKKHKKYRYSRELREETRRGSLFIADDTTLDSLLEVANGSVPSGESLVDTGDEKSRYSTLTPQGTTFDPSEIEVYQQCELRCEAKRKISEHQVRILVLTGLEDNEPCVVSCAGYYGDDESILRWTCHTRENVWMQVPIEDIT
ncbi:TBC1 domain family member 2B-like isoform X2 [Strongylocentrotus purpuratus]|uniref:TBC1 domain family member 2B n=1 Tax=Strongylocentrotus purpuratus TaxID=7668 RepID=A0A7M7PPC4_STRPU|nr:TBC1 domain family member 2B-like isoform X2 [Strongylocentrotus purpuratus]